MMTTVFDPGVLLAEFGDEKLVRELAELLIETAPPQVKKILGAVEGGDANVVKSAAHQLRGALATFGATAATQDAYLLEAMGAAGDLSAAPPVASHLAADVQVLCDSAKAWLAEAA